MNRIRPRIAPFCYVLILVVVSWPALAATMSASPTAPIVNNEDIANYTGAPSDTSKWSTGSAVAATFPKGQSFTTGASPILLNAITYQTARSAAPSKTYKIRVGIVDIQQKTFSEIYSENATQESTWNAEEYMSWTFDAPVLLEPNTQYGIDIGMLNSTVGWQQGIPYLKNLRGNGFTDGIAYTSGTAGFGIGDATIRPLTIDRLFHLDLVHPLQPTPGNNSLVPTGGSLELGWTNLAALNGGDVWVDVWFGTEPNPKNAAKVVAQGRNVNSVTVSATTGGNYYWQVDIYQQGQQNSPTAGQVFSFRIDDIDGDGLPDSYELIHSGSPTALRPQDDPDDDGLTNRQEFLYGTSPSDNDSDDDGLFDADEVNGVGARPATNPTKYDTDEDGLSDRVETNDGSYNSINDVGTSPILADTDKDGFSDGVETNTGQFMDQTNTGTHPLLGDTDNDRAGDWYEVQAAHTDPLDPADSPIVPYPLPLHSGTPSDSSKPVKVYIMSGQSNMVGFGRTNGDGPGTLATVVRQEFKFPNLDGDNSIGWRARDDVMYRGLISAAGNDLLQPGFGANRDSFGPELGFGQIMGYHHDEPVLLIKASIGNRSIAWDYLPPGSQRFTQTDNEGNWTNAGYGDSPKRWITGTTPQPVGWYAGKQFDDCFVDEADRSPMSSALGFGGVTNVVDILDSFSSEYPQYAQQGFEIAGYVWWQGHKDRGGLDSSRYEHNLVNLIKALRSYYETRYPNNTISNAPFVLATVAFDGGFNNRRLGFNRIANGQLAVSGETGNYPEFADNVKTVEARSYWRESTQSPSPQGYHYNHNAETFLLVGDALGRAMIELQGGDDGSGSDGPGDDGSGDDGSGDDGSGDDGSGDDGSGDDGSGDDGSGDDGSGDGGSDGGGSEDGNAGEPSSAELARRWSRFVSTILMLLND